MTPARWAHVKELFSAALETPESERPRFLESACAEDPDLRGEVELLLLGNREPSLQSPAKKLFAAAAELSPGDTVAHYRIEAKLGEGGMGVVYRATDLKLNRTVALKSLARKFSNRVDRQRFLQEAHAASILDHLNIGTIHSIDEAEDGRLYIVMSYYDGEDVSDKIRRGTVRIWQAVDIAFQAANGLAEAHAKGITHRDIKPSNIRITRQGTVKVLDFGLAKFADSEHITQTGAAVGTAAYMSPEQAMGCPVDPRSDIWSLGVVLYEMLAGMLPFRADNVPSTLLAITTLTPPALPQVGPELQAILDRCLAKEPADRYQSMKGLLEDLNRIHISSDTFTSTIADVTPLRPQEGTATPTPRLAPASVKVQRRRLWTALAALFAFSATAAWWIATRGSNGPSPVAYESYLKGLAYLQRYDKPGNADKAIQILQSAVRTDPGFALAYARLGQAQWIKNRLNPDSKLVDEALANCHRAEQLNSQLAPVHVVLGRIDAGTGKYDLAIQEFQRAMQLDPRSAEAYQQISSAYESLGRPDDAEASLKKAVALRPDDWDVHNSLGAFYFRALRNPEAAEAFRKALSLTPDNTAALNNLGLVLRRMQERADARKMFEKVTELNPNWSTYTNLAALYYDDGAYAKAAEKYIKALEFNDRDFRTWSALASAYTALGQQEKSRAACRRALQLGEPAADQDPNNADAQARVAYLCARLGQRDQAVSRVIRSLALSPESRDVLYRAALTYNALGDTDTALKYLALAISQGYGKEQIRQDPDWRNLRGNPTFRSLNQ